MNILFLLLPKATCAYVNEDFTIRQALEKMSVSGFAALPILAKDGTYRGTITEGDLLWAIKDLFLMDMKKAERRTDNPQVLYLHFEDLVYRYDETVEKIEKFTGLTPQLHLHPRTRFIPENSINNTQNFRIEEAWEDEVALFGEAGVDLYPFPYERKTQLEKTFDEQE